MLAPTVIRILWSERAKKAWTLDNGCMCKQNNPKNTKAHATRSTNEMKQTYHEIDIMARFNNEAQAQKVNVNESVVQCTP